MNVAAETPALQTDRADTGRLIEGEQIAAMPLGFGRNFQGMLATVPGASRPFRPHSEFFNSQDSLSTNVNGQSRLANNVMIEGIDDNHKTGLLTVLIPSAEALETVSVIDQQLRRGVRPRRRRGHLGDAQVGHQPVQGLGLLVRQHRRDPGDQRLRRSHAAEGTAEAGRAPTTSTASPSAARSSATGSSSSATTSAPTTISAA